MPTIELNCLLHGDTPDIDNIFSVEIDAEMAVSKLKEIIKEKKQDTVYFDNVNFKLWNVSESNEKLSILFENPNAIIEKKLEGKMLAETDRVFEYFSHELNKEYIHIIVEVPGYHLTFASCAKRKELVPSDKIIFKEDSFEKESEIIGIAKGIRIQFINKSEKYKLYSFIEFIEKVNESRELSSEKETKSSVGQNMIKNLMFHLHVSNEHLSWSDFHKHLIRQRKLTKDLENTMMNEDKLERLGGRKVLSIQDDVVFEKLSAAEDAFLEKFRRDEISATNFGLVDGKEVIIVMLDLPEGSLLKFYLPPVFEGFPVIIDYGLVQPFHRSYHEKLMPGISIGWFNNPPNALTLSPLVQTPSVPGGFYFLTARHGVGKKGSPVCQPGKVDDGCATVTKYNSLSIDNDGYLIDYAFCRLSNNNRVPETDQNKIYGAEINVSSFKTSVGNDDLNRKVDVKKVGKSTFFTERKLKYKWVYVRSAAFDPPKNGYALRVVGSHGPFAGPGDSGAPVFDRDNRLLGIIHGGVKDQSSTYVIPINLIIEHARQRRHVQFQLL
ncbi:leucine-rich repeat and iq domain-containing protein 4-like: PROVISIONAL [Gigaspora margarita]|uniref:Leucine-rich repeat and iq domain-containing protein 4-like: PROVISIONAL n=1 Tax=Gigaspora margarita TaxID=4874 RepID=A0A8H3X5D3_GIGMA|nr:leucine-rich repeat and iq domain-containing protein 4-like: PROVISIONAL [Gigaspora margarita]